MLTGPGTHCLHAARMHAWYHLSSTAALLWRVLHTCCAHTCRPARLRPMQTQAPVLEADDDSGEDLVADSLRQLQESINEVQLKYGRAEQELNEAKLNEDK